MTVVVERRMYAAAPDRSLRQRQEALRKANEIRTYRARLKVDMKLGRVSLRDALRSDDERLGSMKVAALLVAAPKVGRVKANKLLTQSRISPSKTLGGLTERQRDELLGLLGARR